jgi:hypothetical protein
MVADFFPLGFSFVTSPVSLVSLNLFDTHWGDVWGSVGGTHPPVLLPSVPIQPCPLFCRFWLWLSHWHRARGREGPFLLQAAESAAGDFTWEPDGGAARSHSLWGRHPGGLKEPSQNMGFSSGCFCFSKGSVVLMLHLNVVIAFPWGFLLPGLWTPSSFESGKRAQECNISSI